MSIISIPILCTLRTPASDPQMKESKIYGEVRKSELGVDGDTLFLERSMSLQSVERIQSSEDGTSVIIPSPKTRKLGVMNFRTTLACLWEVRGCTRSYTVLALAAR